MNPLPIAIAAAMLTACADSGFVAIPDEGWGRGDTLSLPVRAEAPQRLVVRMDRTYPYRKLCISVNDSDVWFANYPQGVGVYELWVPIALTDSVARIAHRMSDNTLRGVVSIGIVK
ncbi:MAG: hypothetical protein HUK01_08220 [Bacteroidaceae bacterium]|nr:hypothetical protein [Bacteroidaceae bacterium]